MNTLRNILLLSAATTFFAITANSQTIMAYHNGAASKAAKDVAANMSTPYHSHKKLPVLYDGYAIEVATSTYPLDRKNQLFRQFGNVHYDKLERGSYSYLILGGFSDDESVLHFLQNVIAPQVKDARAVHYKEGIRRIVRVD
ncbi:MAG: hypothetical protein R2788_13900 [Saprospiraceae bacterium]|jgi:hypothetical protein